MNNRVQQRMDRSIREAVASEQARRDAKTAETLRHNQDIARRLLPGVEKLLMAGAVYTGRKLTREEVADLKSRRSDYRRTLGLTVDRKMLELPTDLGADQKKGE